MRSAFPATSIVTAVPGQPSLPSTPPLPLPPVLAPMPAARMHWVSIPSTAGSTPADGHLPAADGPSRRRLAAAPSRPAVGWRRLHGKGSFSDVSHRPEGQQAGLSRGQSMACGRALDNARWHATARKLACRRSHTQRSPAAGDAMPGPPATQGPHLQTEPHGGVAALLQVSQLALKGVVEAGDGGLDLLSTWQKWGARSDAARREAAGSSSTGSGSTGSGSTGRRGVSLQPAAPGTHPLCLGPARVHGIRACALPRCRPLLAKPLGHGDLAVGQGKEEAPWVSGIDGCGGGGSTLHNTPCLA